MKYDTPANIPALDAAFAALDAGELVIFPTDTVYGIGSSLRDQPACARIFQLKGRSSQKSLPILISSPDVLDRLSPNPNDNMIALAMRFWPGPLTIVAPARTTLPPSVVHPDGSLGVRMPDHPIALLLADHCDGAIAATSANLSGAAPTTNAQDAARDLAGPGVTVIDGGDTPGNLPSTVVRCDRNCLVIIRQGAIPEEHLMETWREILGQRTDGNLG